MTSGDGSRTRDLKLGKLALYQLSYARVNAIVGPAQAIAGAAGSRSSADCISVSENSRSSSSPAW